MAENGGSWLKLAKTKMLANDLFFDIGPFKLRILRSSVVAYKPK